MKDKAGLSVSGRLPFKATFSSSVHTVRGVPCKASEDTDDRVEHLLAFFSSLSFAGHLAQRGMRGTKTVRERKMRGRNYVYIDTLKNEERNREQGEKYVTYPGEWWQLKC